MKLQMNKIWVFNWNMLTVLTDIEDWLCAMGFWWD